MARTLIVGNDGSNVLSGGAGAELIYGFDPNGPQGQVTSISATRVASGLSEPVFVTSPLDDASRLFMVEKGGLVKILDLPSGRVAATPFLNVQGQIATSGEQGLLGLAFDPDFAHNGFVYVDLINTSGDTEVRRYHVSGTNPNQLDASSATLVLTIDQPAGLTNHKAGWVGFGPDGFLYVAAGDGGGGGDPLETGQNVNDLLGNMLRIDVHGDAFPGDPTRNYAIPAGNPFVGTNGADEIWAFGLRNPWRDSFDRGLGDFYIADVGQNKWEEIDFGQAGANYGWDVIEGPEAFEPGPLTGGSAVAPIYFYGRDVGASVTGGYVYRGPSEGLQGQYFFGDFVAGRIFTLRFNGSAWVATERTSQISANVGAINNPSSFGEDAVGNLYVVDFDGEVFRLTPNVASADQGDELNGNGGDDMMFGGSGSDVLKGGPGNDFLTGGPGDDRFVFVPGGTDVFTDFIAGAGSEDKIDLTAFTDIHTLTDVLARATQVGTDTVIDFGNGDTIRLLNVNKVNLGIDDFVFAGLVSTTLASLLTTLSDLNGDHNGDILWHRDDGLTVLWELNGNQVLGSFGLGNVGTEWQVAGSRDFDGDGRDDILWRRDDGLVVLWEMNGNQITGSFGIATVGNEWKVATVDDFNGDHKSDILWRRDDGFVDLWQMDGPQIIDSFGVATVGNEWHFVGGGEFNGDGKADILWRHDDGTVVLWEMNGPQVIGSFGLGVAGNEWHIVGLNDFNGDQREDILWRRDGGSVVLWELDGNQIIGSFGIATVGNEWHVAATDDANGDGKADILWRGDDGALVLWEMDGPQLLGSFGLGVPGPEWHVV